MKCNTCNYKIGKLKNMKRTILLILFLVLISPFAKAENKIGLDLRFIKRKTNKKTTTVVAKYNVFSFKIYSGVKP